MLWQIANSIATGTLFLAILRLAWDYSRIHLMVETLWANGLVKGRAELEQKGFNPHMPEYFYLLTRDVKRHSSDACQAAEIVHSLGPQRLLGVAEMFHLSFDAVVSACVMAIRSSGNNAEVNSGHDTPLHQ